MITETGQPGIFGVAAVSNKWYDPPPPDLQHIIDKDAAAVTPAVGPQAIAINERTRKGWVDSGGELIAPPPDEQAKMLKKMASAAADVSKQKPALGVVYKIVAAAAERTREAR